MVLVLFNFNTVQNYALYQKSLFISEMLSAYFLFN